MTEQEKTPELGSVADLLVSQSQANINFAFGLAREAKEQARSLEAVLSYFEEPADLGEPAPLHIRHHKPRTSIAGAIAFLRDIGGRDD